MIIMRVTITVNLRRVIYLQEEQFIKVLMKIMYVRCMHVAAAASMLQEWPKMKGAGCEAVLPSITVNFTIYDTQLPKM